MRRLSWTYPAYMAQGKHCFLLRGRQEGQPQGRPQGRPQGTGIRDQTGQEKSWASTVAGLEDGGGGPEWRMQEASGSWKGQERNLPRRKAAVDVVTLAQ